jgi:integrase
LSEIRRADLQAFALWLREEKGQNGKTVNDCLAAGTGGLRWAAENEYIPANPAEGLMKFSGKSAKRGILAEDEVYKLFVKPWVHERAYVGNLLAMSTGLRLGEVLAVQVRDIEMDRLRVRHSWSEQDKLKGTTTSEERAVPLLPDVRTAMLELARKNPHGIGPTAFVFWNTDLAGRPMDPHPLPEELKAALVRSRLSDDDQKDPARVREAVEYWKNRKIVFHSWRHYFAARMGPTGWKRTRSCQPSGTKVGPSSKPMRIMFLRKYSTGFVRLLSKFLASCCLS